MVLAAVVLAAPAQAQTDVRWTPFVGCWQPAAGSSGDGLLCFRLADDDIGVEMITVAEGEIVMTELFRADGREQPIEREGCVGSERAEFSSDSRRIYTRSEYTCAADVAREATGIMSVVSPRQWIDVRSVGVEGEQMAWVQVYELASQAAVDAAGLSDIGVDLGMAIRSTRLSASRPIDFDDVLDAADHVHVKAVEAWIAERGDAFHLTAEDLIVLDDRGLDPNIIDVMVAVSNPGFFSVDQGGQAEAAPMGAGAGGVIPMRSAWTRYPGGRYYDAFFFDPFYYGYSSRYSYGYSPWGYGGGYGWYGGYVQTPVIVQRQTPQSGGRVVNGRGYSRSGGSSGSYSGSSGSRSSGSSSRGATARSTGSSTSAGSSSSGGTSTGRTATRRGGGG
jgi:hypothetical protein